MSEAFEAVTITLPDESEVLVRTWADGTVDVDLRTQTTKFGPRVWTPIALLGGEFTVEHCGNVDYGVPVLDEAEIVARFEAQQ